MTDRAVLYEQFVTRFHSGRRPKPFTVARIESAEAALGILWPSSYRSFVTTYGAVYTPDLLDLLDELQSESHDLQQFLKPTEVVKEIRSWRNLGMNDDCCPFAHDCMGSFFMFRGLPAIESRPDDAPVWFNDHEYETIEPVAASFDEWLGQFLRL